MIDRGGPRQKASGTRDRQKAGADEESNRDLGDPGYEFTEGGQQRRQKLHSDADMRSTSYREKKAKTKDFIRVDKSSH